MTPDEAVTTVRYQIAEESANFFSDDELRSYLTMGEREIANLLECNEEVTTVTLTTGTYSYATGLSGYNTIDHITYSGNEAYKLKGVDFRDLQAVDDQVMSPNAQSGDPTHYWRYGGSVVLWPTPDASGTIAVYGTKTTTAVVSGATAFSINNQFTEYLPDYVLFRCYMKDQDNGRATMHKQVWEEHKVRAQRENSRRRYSDRLLVVKTEPEYPTTILGIV